MSAETNSKRRDTQSGALLRFLLLPALFSSCAWWIALARSAPVLPPLPAVALRTHASGTSVIVYDKNLVPDDMWDAYRLGKIAHQMHYLPSKYKAELGRYNLTVGDLEEGRLSAAIEEHCKRRKIFKGLFSFVGILSLISVVGIFATLWPTLKFLYAALHVDRLWRRLIQAAAWIVKVMDPLLGVICFAIPLLIVDQSLHFPEDGARSQMNILAAGFALAAFFYEAWRRERTPLKITDHEYFATSSFAWGFTFLVTLALIGNSQVLGFLAVGSIFGALGFVALPMPYGWAAGFRDEVSMDKCMVISTIVLIVSVAAKTAAFPSPRVLGIFQLGLSVFGMLAFGLAGLIKSSRASHDSCFAFGGATALRTFVYPISWLVLGLVGLLVPYQSLTNISITFVCLWVSQFYWRMAGFTSVSVFVFSCVLFYVTLQLRVHREFVESLFQV